MWLTWGHGPAFGRSAASAAAAGPVAHGDSASRASSSSASQDDVHSQEHSELHSLNVGKTSTPPHPTRPTHHFCGLLEAACVAPFHHPPSRLPESSPPPLHECSHLSQHADLRRQALGALGHRQQVRTHSDCGGRGALGQQERPAPRQAPQSPTLCPHESVCV